MPFVQLSLLAILHSAKGFSGKVGKFPRFVAKLCSYSHDATFLPSSEPHNIRLMLVLRSTSFRSARVDRFEI